MKVKEEIWKDIPNYEGLYQVSNLGRVKSLDRKVKHSVTGLLVNRKGKIIKNNKSSSYYRCVLSACNNRKTYLVHQLVAMAFLGHKIDGHKIVVDHIDNDKTNNNVKNLQLISSRLNSSKDIKNKTSKYIGVCWHKRDEVWVSQIIINGKKHFLGAFNSEVEASNMYQSKLKTIN